MAAIESDDPAFETSERTASASDKAPSSLIGGLTLRQFYAGMALSGIMGRPATTVVDLLVHDAFTLADAMIAYERGGR